MYKSTAFGVFDKMVCKSRNTNRTQSSENYQSFVNLQQKRSIHLHATHIQVCVPQANRKSGFACERHDCDSNDRALWVCVCNNSIIRLIKCSKLNKFRTVSIHLIYLHAFNRCYLVAQVWCLRMFYYLIWGFREPGDVCVFIDGKPMKTYRQRGENSEAGNFICSTKWQWAKWESVEEQELSPFPIEIELFCDSGHIKVL